MTSSGLRTIFGILALWALATTHPAIAADRDGLLVSDPVSDLMDRRYDDLRRTSAASSDLRLRILFSRVSHVGDNATTFVDAVGLPVLLDAARGSTDPLVLQLLIGRCIDNDAPASCDPLALARRWTAADTQNQASWMTLASIQQRAGDVAGARDSWDRVGRASTLRDPMYEYARTVAAALPVDRDARLRHLDLLFVVGVAAAVPTPWLLDALHGCRDAARQRACAHVADTAFRDATTFVMLDAGVRLSSASRMSSTVVADRQRSADALLSAHGRLTKETDFVTFGAADDAAWQRANRVLEDRIARGEIAPARDALRAGRSSTAPAVVR